MRRPVTCILAVVLLGGGCATHRPTAHSAEQPAASTRPVSKSDLAIDQIEPHPVLAVSKPTTEPSSPPSLDAIQLFAQARAAMLQGQRYTAVNLLEKAIRLDPGSYELRFALGQAYSSGGVPSDQSIAAYEAAAAIEADHVTVHTELGRQCLAKGQTPKAIEHLLLATQTTDYRDDESQAAIVDFYLGKALQQAGYEQAALESYEKLIDRLQAGGLAVRGSPELAYLVSQPEGLFSAVAELMQRRGRNDEAIRFYELAADRKPDDFGYQASLTRALMAAGRQEDAAREATDIVQHFRASPDSLALLKDVYRQTGGDEAVVRELARLHRERPDDRTVLYALVDVMTAQGKTSEAAKMLAEAAPRFRYETDLTRRLFRLYDQADDVDAAAKLLIEALAARPDNTRDIAPMWAELLRPWRKNHLTVARVQALQVSPQAQAARDFWIAELAKVWNREALSRSSLEQAVKQVPPFAPAYRALINQTALRDDWDKARKEQASLALIESVDRQGDAALAAELRGLMLLGAGESVKASDEFAKAQKLGDNAADLRLAYATALQASGESGRADQVLAKLAEDEPTCEDAFLQLFRSHLQQNHADRAVQVLKSWLAADPSSVSARIVESTVLYQAGRLPEAEKSLLELFASEPDNVAVLAAMGAFYEQTQRNHDFIAKLEVQRTEHPENRAAVEQLVMLYVGQNKLPEAIRVLDATRAAVGSDPDLRYYIASLYTRIGQKQTGEQMLEQIVQSNPTYAPACNDLGYSWADEGKNLPRAESLIRTAVQGEPDNHSFLDSLGWVLYKRGQFQEARVALQNAVDAASYPDPVVLDHLGDTIYRLDDRKAAAALWRRSLDRLPKADADGERDEIQKLRVQLQQKIKQFDAGQAVSVAPVASEPPKQAKN